MKGLYPSIISINQRIGIETSNFIFCDDIKTTLHFFFIGYSDVLWLEVHKWFKTPQLETFKNCKASFLANTLLHNIQFSMINTTTSTWTIKSRRKSCLRSPRTWAMMNILILIVMFADVHLQTLYMLLRCMLLRYMLLLFVKVFQFSRNDYFIRYTTTKLSLARKK